MKKIAFLLVAVLFTMVGVDSAKAQWYDYNVALEYQQAQRLNQISAQNAMMEANILNFYRQQAAAATYHMMNTPFVPMSGVLTYDGVYLTPSNINEYTKVKEDCDNCDGGYIYTRSYNGVTIKRSCGCCKGKGYVIRTVKKQ